MNNQTKLQKEETRASVSTDLEFRVLTNLIENLYAEPGFSDIGCQEIADNLSLPVNTVKGVVGNLVKKGVVSVGDDDFADIIYLENDYYHLHPEWWSEQVRTRQ